MNRLPVKAIMFDLDGTLIDTIPIIIESYQATYDHFGKRFHDADEIKAGIGLPLEEIFMEYPDEVQDMLDWYIAYNMPRMGSHVGIYLGIPHMLAELKAAGYPLAIVTAKRLENARQSLRDFELLPYFDAVVTKFDTDIHKPDPEPLHMGRRKLGINNPEEVLYVGDSVHDLQAANNGHYPSAAVGWSAMPHADLRAENPTLWVDTPADLIRLLILKK